MAGGGRGRGGFKDTPREKKEESYLVAHPIKAEWITTGADAQLVAYAEQAGKDLVAKKLTNTQIRRIYGEVKRIQMGTWEKNRSAFYLLKPKVAYAYGRDKSDGMKIFKEIFDEATKSVRDNKTYDNFCNFMEAILAYHRANSGK